MLPRAMTLSLDLAEVENSVPCGRMKPRLLAVMALVLLTDERLEWVERVDAPEKVRSSGAVSGPEMARRSEPAPPAGGVPGEGGVEGGVLAFSSMVGVLRVLVGVVRGVALGVTSEDISSFS